MAEAPDEFEKQVVRNCPSDAPYYYLLRYDENNEPIQFPSDRALRTRTPFEHPIGCKPGDWLVIYSSDQHGHSKIQHVGSKPHVEVRLSLPRSVCDAAQQGPTGPTDQDLVEMLTKQQELEDDAEGSLKATRLDAKKREIAIDLATKEQKLMLRAAKNKELAEGWMLNRAYRMESRDQSESMFRLQNQSVAMIERQFVLMEKMQEVFGRFAEIEKAAAQRMASPPPPVDYTPVLSSVVSAIRDIGVSAMQRDDRKRLKSDEDSPPVKAALADKAPDAGAALSSAEKPTATLAATGSPPAPPTVQPTMTELQALYARMQAERDRLKSELDAERNRQRVLDEIHAGATNAPSPAAFAPRSRAEVPAPAAHNPPRPLTPRPPREPGSLFPRTASRNSGCPCGSGRPYKKCCMNKGRQAELPVTPPGLLPANPVAIVPGASLVASPPPANPVAIVPGASLVASPPPANPVAIAPGASLVASPPPANPVATVPGASLVASPPPANPVATAPGASLVASPPPANPVAIAPGASLVASPPPANPVATVPGASLVASPPPANPVATAPGASLVASPPPANPVATVPGASLASKPSQVVSAVNPVATVPGASLPTPDASAPSPGPSPANPVATVPGASLAGAPSPSLPSAKALAESQGLPFNVPSDQVNPELNELLVNMLAGKMLADPDTPIPPPLVAQVKQMDEVIVKPPKMDPETARKLLNDGSTMEAFGAFLFFNPLVRTILLNRRGK